MGLPAEIGHRMRLFGESKFKSTAEFARALKVSPQQLNNYLNGRSLPGNKMESRLRDLGCDVIWLQHGVTQGEIQRQFEEMVQRIGAARDVTDKEREILAVLRGFEIDDVYELEQCFSVVKASEIKMQKLTKRLAEKSAGSRRSSKNPARKQEKS